MYKSSFLSPIGSPSEMTPPFDLFYAWFYGARLFRGVSASFFRGVFCVRPQ